MELKDIKKIFEKIILLIKQGEIEKSQEIFNEEIFEKYKDKILDSKNILNIFVFLFLELDNYLNKKNYKILGATDKEKIINEYLDVLEKIK